jgi:hypothetical protein
MLNEIDICDSVITLCPKNRLEFDLGAGSTPKETSEDKVRGKSRFKVSHHPLLYPTIYKPPFY